MTQQETLRDFAKAFSSFDEGAKQILISELRFYFNKRNESDEEEAEEQDSRRPTHDMDTTRFHEPPSNQKII